MMRKTLVLLLALVLLSSAALALTPQHKTGTLITPPTFDTFNDTIKYDNGTIAWWYGGLSNFVLATKFTPLSNFEMQRVIIAMNGTSSTPVNLYLKADSLGYPGGAPIWSGTLVYNASNTWLGVTIDTTGLPQYTFAAGSNFWLTVNSNGPPYEIYDAAPVQPPRSKTYAIALGGWVDSPGDNFIRAVGEYSGGIVDVGCDSIWHGQNFHLPNPGTLTVGCKVKNYGTASATFQVACSLFTEGSGPSYTFYSALTQQTVTLAAGATSNVTFPATTINVNNRYRIRARTLLAGDIFPDNNTRDTETQIYTAPAELRYDDDYYNGAAYSSTVGFGWGMKFNPHQTGNYNITQIRVMADFTAGDLAARVQVLDDNGAGGAPGTILWQVTQVMVAGWNTFNVNLTNQTGSFYIGYIFEHGDSTSALRMDGYPSSGMGWNKASSTAAWTADPDADDWMMRATISAGGGVPNVTIDLEPVSPPIQIPPGGGSFNFNASIHNGEATSQTFGVWIMVQLPNGSWWGPALGPLTLTLTPGFTLTRTRTQSVPGSAPAGAYVYEGRVGTYPATVWDSDSFPFTKLAVGDGGALVPEWSNTGQSFEIGQTEVTQMPSAFTMGVRPNPFNPTTTISFALPEAARVTLSVYDVSGRQVAELVNGWRDAGSHEVTFDGSNLTSGIYVYRLTADNFSASGKMVLMK